MNSSIPPTLIIEAGRTERHYWKDLWRYRELLFFLAWRDLLVRYKQTAIGVAWAIIRPAITMVVFTVVFGKLAKLPSGDVPYPILVFVGLLPWFLFASAMSDAGTSIVGSGSLISKVYFPRMLVPLSAIVVSLADFLLSSLILAVMMLWYDFAPDWRIMTLPVFMAIALCAAFGVGLWITALNVKYRDFQFVIPFIMQAGLYISPVGFSSAVVPDQWRFLYSLNPMVGVIDGFRWAILGGKVQLYWPGFILSLGLVAALLFSGIYYFRKTERTFADVI